MSSFLPSYIAKGNSLDGSFLRYTRSKPSRAMNDMISINAPSGIFHAVMSR